MRLFLAIRLPEDALRQASELQDELRARIARQGVRFTPQHKLHLTLAFLGNDREPEEADRIAAGVAPVSGPLHLALGRLGAFPGLERPKTIWLGVDGERLSELVGRLGSAFALEPAQFVGHVTMARVSPPSKAVGWALQTFLREGTALNVNVAWTATEVELIASLPGGEYETLNRYSL